MLTTEVGMSIVSAHLIRVVSRLIDCCQPPEAMRLNDGRR